MIGLELILKLNDMSFKDLADKLGITKQNVSMWLSGERKVPKKYLAILEDIFKVSKEYYQKELTQIEKLEIEKQILEIYIKNYEENDEEDKKVFDKYSRLEELEIDIKLFNVFSKFKSLFQDKTNDEIEGIAYTLEVFFKIYENKKLESITFYGILHAINDYLQPEKISDDDSVSSEFEFDIKYSKQIDEWEDEFYKLLDKRQIIEKEYNKAEKEFWSKPHEVSIEDLKHFDDEAD